ncbi:ubiquitin carboxyl-terminal hydrolase 31-like [Elysia marginata]|uniref:ubiquitinyl hydrolase 1 n=1 Tax=Elysia marginata TaxID=1093978 RepID=A0AAV4EH04_9GAST|nr:ubiquitin carboxyl-terminal hydrolase 31-like [Elysia marginata]
MSNIPGGRPRASSDGDILDDGLCNIFFDNEVEGGVKAYHGNSSPLNKHRSNISTNFSSHSCLDANDLFESDGEDSSQSHNSSLTTKSHKSIFSFKSVKKAVSRRFARDANSRFLPSTKKTDLKLPKKVDLAKIWTPDLRSFGNSNHLVLNGKECAVRNSTMSTARPLITDPHVRMTVPKWKRTPGVIGILNHGNSCFMNAVLQCLSNTDSFTEYFVKDFYKCDLKNNKSSKKSVFRFSQGEVTEQLGILLKSIWSGKYSSVVSREFKSVVGKFSNQYKGDHQHDAQEFLLWLLDRIHEDVCIYLKKKQKPQKSPALLTKSDEDAASEAASVNGESFVVRLFQALHASTLTCPTCKRRSSTFDPYLCVSLPLPQHCFRHLSLVLVPLLNKSSSDGRGSLGERLSPTSPWDGGGEGGSLRVALTINQYDTVGELKVKLCCEVPELELNAKEIILVQLREDGFGSTYSNEQPVSDIGEGEALYALEAASSPDADGSTSGTTRGVGQNSGINGGLQGADEFDTPMAQVMVLHVDVSPGSNRSYRFGSPAMLKVRRDITWKALRKEILYKMGNAVYEWVLSQKLGAVFKLRVYDGSSRRNSLSSDVEMPLYTQDVERAFETLNEDFGPVHIKLTAEWDYNAKKAIVSDSREYIDLHRSVQDAHTNSPRYSKVSLDECFKLYTQEEKLSGEDAWTCPHCKQQQPGTIKTLGLWSLPDILVLHLKRFKQTGFRRSKLNTLVDFPVEGLDMSPYLAKNKKGGGGCDGNTFSASSQLRPDDHTYDLLGVSNHYGDMMGGHYIAVCKSPVDGVWREFNDQRVRPLDEGEPIATKEAYLLFYQRRSLGKDINHRLFTGDHWAFSLSLAPSELKEEGSSSGGSTPRGEIVPPIGHNASLRPRQRSLPRSVSPSALKHSGREYSSWTAAASRRSTSSTRPLTPQPHRKPIIPYSESRFSDGDNDYNYDDTPSSPTRASSPPIRNGTSRRSRPVQRQASEPGPRRGKTSSSTAGDSAKFQDPPSRTVYDRQSQYDNEKEEELVSYVKSGRKVDVTSITKPQVTARDKSSTRVPARHESQGLSDAALSVSHRNLPPVRSNSLESDTKYLNSYERGNYSDHMNNLPLSAYEPASTLRVKLEDSDAELTIHSLPPYKAAAGRRLAERIDLDRQEDTPLQKKDFTNREFLARQQPGKIASQNSYDLARQNIIDMDSNMANLRIFYGNRLNGHRPSLDLDKSKAEDQGRSDNNNSSKFLPLNGHCVDSDVEEEEEEEEEEEVDETGKSLPRTILQGNYDKFVNLAEKYFGPRSYKKEKYVSLLSEDDLPSTFTGRRGVADYGSAGVVRLHNHEMPRSSTDYSIHYSLTSSEYPAPPSPTPPRGSAEERTFTTSGKMAEHGGHTASTSSSSSSFAYPPSFSYSHSATSSRLTDREIKAMQSYQFAGRTGVLDKGSKRSSGVRTLPGYISGASDWGIRESRHNFRPPRGVWGSYGHRGVKDSQPTSIPAPCLRESSV